MGFGIGTTVPDTQAVAASLPTFTDVPYEKRGVVTAGLKSGGYGMLSAFSGALSGGAKILGADNYSQIYADKAAEFANSATAVGRPDIENQDWFSGGLGAFGKKLAYTAASAVPNIAGAVGTGALAVAALPEEAALGAGAGAAGLLGRAGAALPGFLGGGEAVGGAQALAGIGGAAATMVPQSFGEQVNEAAKQPGGLTRGDALRAAVQAVPVGLAQSIVPAEGTLTRGGAGLLGQLSGKFGKNVAAKFAEHGITNAAAGAVGSGLQAAADTSFDPSMSPGDRAGAIVHATVQGAIGGGLIGGIFGLAHMDKALKDVGVDPQDPAGTTAPTQPQLPGPAPMLQLTGPNDTLRTQDGRIFDTRPRPAPETPLNETQSELHFSAPLIPSEPGTQFHLFDGAPAPTLPVADLGTAPPPYTRADVRAAAREARAARVEAAKAAAPAAPTDPDAMARTALRQGEPPPPNLTIKNAARDASINLKQAPKSFREFVNNSSASSMPELLNELRSVPSDADVAQTKTFTNLLNKLSPADLDARVAKAQADPSTPKATTDLLNYQLDLRNRADAIKAQADAAKATAAPAEAPAPQVSIPAVAAPDDIPELSGPDVHTTPAVPADADVARAAEAASPHIQTAGPSVVEGTPDAGGSSVAPAAASGPQSIADKVIEAAHSATKGQGGDVDIAQIRAALPDVAPEDLNAALAKIHLDDSDHELVQNPKGQRKGVDSIKVPGSGTFHKLSVAARDADAAQVGSAAPQAGADQPGRPAAAGGGDAAGQQVARAGAVLDEAGSQGAAEPAGQGAAEPAGQGAAAPRVEAPATLPDAVAAYSTALSKIKQTDLQARSGSDNLSKLVDGVRDLGNKEYEARKKRLLASTLFKGDSPEATEASIQMHNLVRQLDVERGKPDATFQPVRDANGNLNPLEGETPEQTALRDQRLKVFGQFIGAKDPFGESGKVDLTPQDPTKPRTFYRGQNPDSAERISTGNPDWDSHLFVSSNRDSASMYGRNISTYNAAPDAKILYAGTREFRELAKGLGKKNLLDQSSEIAARAKSAGYDAVHFERQGDVGTAIINPEKFTLDTGAAATQAKLAPEPAAPKAPEQVAQTAAKTDAAATMLSAPQAAKAANAPVTAKLRRQTKVKTAMLETPVGDQLPTAAVGADLSEIPQALASSTDPIMPAGPAEPIAKVPFGRMPGIAGNAPVVDRTALDAHVARFAAKLRPDVAAKIKVIDSADGFPADVRAAMQRNGDDMSATPALYHKSTGEVFIRADQMRNLGEVEDALSHEVFGHLATAKRFANATDYQSAMTRLFNKIGGADDIENLARKAGVWAPGDDGGNLEGGAGLSAYLPKDRANMSPLQKTRVLDELIAHRAAANPSAVDLAIQSLQDMARKGLGNTLKRAGLTNFGNQLLDSFTSADLSKWAADSRKALAEPPKPGSLDLAAGASDPRLFLSDMEPTGEPPFMAKIAAQQRDYQGLMGLAGSLRDHIFNSGIARDLFGEKGMYEQKPGLKSASLDALRTVINNIAPATHFVSEAVRNGMSTIQDHNELKTSVEAPIRNRVSEVGNKVAQAHRDLRLADPVQAKRLDILMDLTTRNNINPMIPFADHTWLQKLPPDQYAEQKALHAEAQADYNRLGLPGKDGKVTTGQKVYQDQIALSKMNWYAAKTMAAHDALRLAFPDVNRGYEPARRFAGLDHDYVDAAGNQLANQHFADASKSLAFWKGEFDRINAVASEHSATLGQRPENVGLKPYQDLAQLTKDNKVGEDGYVKQGPYFRLGRSGDYSVAFKVPEQLGPDGKPNGRADPAKLAALQQGYAEKFPQISIGNSTDNRQVFARFPTEDLAKLFAKRVQDGGDLKQHIDQGAPVRVSLLSNADHMDGAVPFLKQHLDDARVKFDQELAGLDPASTLATGLRAARDHYLGNLRATLLDLQGDTSQRSLQARRDNVQGSTLDMLANQKSMSDSYSRAVSSTAVRADKTEALATARQAIKTAGESGDQGIKMQRIYDAYQERNKAADVRVDNSFLSWAKSGLHTFQLGASPSYVIMNLSQLGTLGLPEFAKFHGFANSMGAMVNATGDANRVIAAMTAKAPDGTRGVIEGGITNHVLDLLRKGGMSDSKIKFLTDLVNHDHIELGSYSSVNSGLGVGDLGRVQRFQQYANSTALLAETYSRLIMGFAAKRLHESEAGQKNVSLQRQFPDAVSYASHVIPETMMRWGSETTPKLFTAGGALGKAGPVVTQFHGWVPRLVEKLYREAADGYTNRLGTGPEADAMRAEARRFTMNHLAAVATISGGLGLPFAGYAAGAATKISAYLPGAQQPYDVEQHLHDLLEDTFGKDAAHVITHGLPRYLGVDMADLGDNDFLPFARLMEDRRKFEDAMPDYASHAWGSGVGMLTNSVIGARELAEGRFAEAGARSLPTVLRNFVRAYRVDQFGYTNSQGSKLPIAAGGAEVLKTALGLQGGELANERDRQNSLAGLRDDRQYRMSLIKKDLALATNRGDSGGVAQAYAAAQKFDQDNPGVGFSKQLQGFLEKKASAEAFGRMTQTLGLRPGDLTANALIR